MDKRNGVLSRADADKKREAKEENRRKIKEQRKNRVKEARSSKKEVSSTQVAQKKESETNKEQLDAEVMAELTFA